MNYISTVIVIVSSIVAAVATVVAAWYTRTGARAAKKSLLLSQEQDRRRAPNLEIYLKESYIRRSKYWPCRIYAFHIRITNNSDTDNTAKELRLVVTFEHDSARTFELVLPHDATLTETFCFEESIPLTIPCAIGSHRSMEGWALFKVNNDLICDAAVPSYILEILDTHNATVTLEPVILRERSDDKQMA